MVPSVSFSDVIHEIPEDILHRYDRPVSWDDEVCRSFGVDRATFERSTIRLQRFLKRNIVHLQWFQDEKIRIYEEMEDVAVSREGDRLRLELYVESRKREIDLETGIDGIDVEMEQTPSPTDQQEELMKTAKRIAKEIKMLEIENREIQRQCVALHNVNRKEKMKLVSQKESYINTVLSMKTLERENRRVKPIHDKFKEYIEALEGCVRKVDQDAKHEKQWRKKIKSCLKRIMYALDNDHDRTKFEEKVQKLMMRNEREVALANVPIEMR